MALQHHRSSGFVRLLAVALAVGMIATVGVFALPGARAIFTGMTVANSRYWGGHTFVPGETMSITMTGTAGDSIDLTIQNGSGNPSYARTGIIIPAAGTITVTYAIPASWPDSTTYTVQGVDTTSTQTRTVGFTVRAYRMDVWTNHDGYLIGDQVQVSWSVVYELNNTPVPAGSGALQVRDSGFANLLPSAQFNFSLPQGSYTFNASAPGGTPDTDTVYGWFNDTTTGRRVVGGWDYGIGNLGLTLAVQTPPFPQPYFYPGQTVDISIATPITGIGGGVFEPNVAVSVTVTDQASGQPVAAYSNPSVSTDATGHLVYVVQLATSPTSGSYVVNATATAHGTLTTTAGPTAPFTVGLPPSFTASLSLDREAYIGGDTITATAKVVSNVPQSFTYTWWVFDPSGNTAGYQAGGGTTYSYTIPATMAGTLTVRVRVDNGTGGSQYAAQVANVAYGYLTVNLDRAEYAAGDTITASFALRSNLITNPTYAWSVTDTNGVPVASGSTTSTSASYQVPSSPSTDYTFEVTASASGWSVSGSASASLQNGFFLTVTPDRSSYNPGETITLAYTVTQRGTDPMPAVFYFAVGFVGMPPKFVQTAASSGTITYTIPNNAPTGNQLLLVQDMSVGLSTAIVVHVGPVNPLLTDVAGVPLFDILIFLLFVVLLLAVILLWRRTGMGRVPPGTETGKPTAPPPPPPSGPSQQAGGPMSVACKHCGANIEITTSKRPIEVMCPSCGETQVVQ